MNTAKPTKICAAPAQFGSTGATSAPKAARQIITRDTSMSSSAHPVNGTAPVTPVAFSNGVSTTPSGGADVPLKKSERVTLIGPGELDAPTSVRVIVPAMTPPVGSPPTDTTLSDRLAGPLPDEGVTWSQGSLEVAVHVTVPAPALVRRTICGAVCERNAAPLVTAPNRIDVLSSDIIGPEGFDG